MNCKNLLILFLLLLILSCKNRSFSAKAINSSTAPFINIKDSSIQLKLHPADNTSIYYTIQLKTNMSEEINDKKRESESNIDIGIQYKIKKDTGNNYLFSLRYDQFKLHVKLDSVDKEKFSHALDKSLGKPTQWTNAVSGINYTVTPQKKVEIANNPYCREYSLQEEKDGKSRDFTGTACVDASSNWQPLK